jgi:hypothetical protein
VQHEQRGSSNGSIFSRVEIFEEVIGVQEEVVVGKLIVGRCQIAGNCA